MERHPSLDDRFDPAIRIVDHDPAWPELARAELRRIEDALDGVAVRLDHVGSTAVPGLAAKPILDLQLTVAAIDPRMTAEAARYAALKRELVAAHPQDRLAYIEGKEDYVAALEARALAWVRR